MSIIMLIIFAVLGFIGLLLLAGAIVMIAFEKTRPFGLGLLLFLLSLPIVGGLFFYSRIAVVQHEHEVQEAAVTALEDQQFTEEIRRRHGAEHPEHLIELREEVVVDSSEAVEEASGEAADTASEGEVAEAAGEVVVDSSEAVEETSGEAADAASEGDDLQEITNLVTGETRDDLPDWTRDDENARPGPNGKTHYTLKIGPMENGAACWEETPEAVKELLQRHAVEQMGYSPYLVSYMDLPWEHLARQMTEGDLWLEPFETSFGDWVLLHARVTVDEKIERQITEELVYHKQWAGLKRLLMIGGVLIGFLLLLWLMLGALVKRRQPSKGAKTPEKA